MTDDISMSDAAVQPPNAPPEIPDKLYFRIGEVSEILGVEPYVLRYWETEFPHLSPKKSSSGHRLYRRKEVELLLQIKHLLYEKRYTIEGARQTLAGEGRAARKKSEPKRGQAELFPEDPIPAIRRELADILNLLK
jgi:DNA-binding transcriptional MerR regulator